MTRISLIVSDEERRWRWDAEVSDSVTEIARATNNPAIFADLISMFYATGVSVCMKPDLVPPGVAIPFKID